MLGNKSKVSTKEKRVQVKKKEIKNIHHGTGGDRVRRDKKRLGERTRQE